ncbi:10972_t:CDS:2, partial [Diversispora eburnea]
TEVSITTTPSILSSQISNLEDIVNENGEFSEIVNIFDSFSDSNSDGNKICSRFCKRYKKKTGLDPWIKSETSEISPIEKTDNYLSQDCVIKISKFPEEKSIIHETVYKCFPFLSYTNSNAWYQDVFKYTDPEAKCPICKEVHTRLGIWNDWSCLEFTGNSGRDTKQNPPLLTRDWLTPICHRHKMDPKKFSVITEAEKKRWTMGCFLGDLERDICCYRGEIKRNEDTRKYHKFLTDRDRSILLDHK